MERRKQVRYPYRQLVLCHLPSADGEVPTRVFAANVSPTGISLRIVRHPLQVGDLVRLELADPQARPVRPATMRVVHLTEQRPGEWLVGGAFTTELSSQDIDALLPYPRPMVLVVEEDEEVRRLMEVIFTVHGVAVKTVPTGQQAIELYRQQPQAFGLVVMDMDLPDLGGVQTLADLRAIHSPVPCILLTAGGSRYTLKELEQQGVLCVIPKPLPRLGQLVRTFSDLLGKLG